MNVIEKWSTSLKKSKLMSNDKDKFDGSAYWEHVKSFALSPKSTQVKPTSNLIKASCSACLTSTLLSFPQDLRLCKSQKLLSIQPKLTELLCKFSKKIYRRFNVASPFRKLFNFIDPQRAFRFDVQDPKRMSIETSKLLVKAAIWKARRSLKLSEPESTTSFSADKLDCLWACLTRRSPLSSTS